MRTNRIQNARHYLKKNKSVKLLKTQAVDVLKQEQI